MWPSLGTSRQYYMLMGSLPALPAHFEDAKRLPISQLRLDNRLRMLHDQDAVVVAQICDFLMWDRQPADRTDEEVTLRYNQYMASVEDPFAREFIDTRMTLRTVVSALRRKRLGLGPPIGVGWVAKHIAQHWRTPQFRLAWKLPWIVQVQEQLNNDSPLELERLLLSVVWQHATRLAETYQFSLEAVVLYIIRWEIVSRWMSHDAAVGREKFQSLLSEALGKHAQLFSQPS